MQVREILDNKMSHEVCTITEDDSVFAAARMMTEKRIGVLAVLKHSKLVGVISERDILTKIVSEDLDSHRVSVGEIMTKELVVARLDESFESCEEKMMRAHCRHILIVDGQKLVGIISLRDILDSSSLDKMQEVSLDEKRIWALPAY